MKKIMTFLTALFVCGLFAFLYGVEKTSKLVIVWCSEKVNEKTYNIEYQDLVSKEYTTTNVKEQLKIGAIYKLTFNKRFTYLDVKAGQIL